MQPSQCLNADSLTARRALGRRSVVSFIEISLPSESLRGHPRVRKRTLTVASGLQLSLTVPPAVTPPAKPRFQKIRAPAPPSQTVSQVW
jgi:hypothetical protein